MITLGQLEKLCKNAREDGAESDDEVVIVLTDYDLARITVLAPDLDRAISLCDIPVMAKD